MANLIHNKYVKQREHEISLTEILTNEFGLLADTDEYFHDEKVDLRMLDYEISRQFNIDRQTISKGQANSLREMREYFVSI